MIVLLASPLTAASSSCGLHSYCFPDSLSGISRLISSRGSYLPVPLAVNSNSMSFKSRILWFRQRPAALITSPQRSRPAYRTTSTIMEVDDVATRLRGARRKRPTRSSGYTVPQKDLDRIRSAASSKWVDSVAASRVEVEKPRRPQSSPMGSTSHGKLKVT